MEYLIVVLISFFFGWKIRELVAIWQSNKLAKRFEQTISNHLEEVKQTFIPIVIEKHNDVFFVYNMETNTFMAQGVDRKDLEHKLGKMFPGKRFEVDPENLRKVGL